MNHRFGAFLLLACLTAPVQAQTPPAVGQVQPRQVPEPPRGVSGTVVSVGDESVVLKQKDGTAITVAMAKGWTVSRPRKGAIDELRLGDFVGSANVDQAPGVGMADELRVFEPGYRPEYGTHPINATGTSMTHGFVFSIASIEGATKVEVAYPDGRRTVILPAGLTPTISDLLPRSAAAPGTEVTGVTRMGKDGVRRAARLTLRPVQ